MTEQEQSDILKRAIYVTKSWKPLHIVLMDNSVISGKLISYDENYLIIDEIGFKKIARTNKETGNYTEIWIDGERPSYNRWYEESTPLTSEEIREIVDRDRANELYDRMFPGLKVLRQRRGY
jgi:small nuclear ribonucleoprotein (snRNP)-like protein